MQFAIKHFFNMGLALVGGATLLQADTINTSSNPDKPKPQGIVLPALDHIEYRAQKRDPFLSPLAEITLVSQLKPNENKPHGKTTVQDLGALVSQAFYSYCPLLRIGGIVVNNGRNVALIGRIIIHQGDTVLLDLPAELSSNIEKAAQEQHKNSPLRDGAIPVNIVSINEKGVEFGNQFISKPYQVLYRPLPFTSKSPEDDIAHLRTDSPSQASSHPSNAPSSKKEAPSTPNKNAPEKSSAK